MILPVAHADLRADHRRPARSQRELAVGRHLVVAVNGATHADRRDRQGNFVTGDNFLILLILIFASFFKKNYDLYNKNNR